MGARESTTGRTHPSTTWSNTLTTPVGSLPPLIIHPSICGSLSLGSHVGAANTQAGSTANSRPSSPTRGRGGGGSFKRGGDGRPVGYSHSAKRQRGSRASSPGSRSLRSQAGTLQAILRSVEDRRPPPATRKPKVLISACSYEHVAGLVRPLVDVPAEADAIQAAFPAHTTTRIDNPSVDELARQLVGRATWFFLGHGDALVRGERNLLFVGETGRNRNGLQALSHAALVSTLGSACDQLSLVVLNGCKTRPLAEVILAHCPTVENVICWQSTSHSAAAGVFGATLAKGLAEHGTRTRGVQRAFDGAKAAVLRQVKSRTQLSPSRGVRAGTGLLTGLLTGPGTVDWTCWA